MAQISQAAPANTANTSKTPDTFRNNQTGIFTVQTSSRLVVLDVVVTDKKGNLVTNLKREDFAVTEANEPETIFSFETALANRVAPSVTINSTAELDRQEPNAPVNIIVLDEFNTRFEDMAFARYSLKKFLESQPDNLATPTMLISVGVEHFMMLHDYTQDKRAIISALDHHFAADPWRAESIGWVPARVDTAFGTLMLMARATAGHPGHKNMLWIGLGLPPMNLTGLQVDSKSRLDTAVQNCVNALRDARVTLYSLDPAAVKPNISMVTNNNIGNDADGIDSEAGMIDPFAVSFEFNRMAVATGGKVLRGRNDIDAAIGETVREGTEFYTLSYRPTTVSQDPEKFRKIKVTIIDHPGLTAATSEGYYAESPMPVVDAARPSKPLIFDLVAAEKSTLVYDGVPISVTATANRRGAFAVHIDGHQLSWSDATATEPRKTQVILIASTFDRKGKELKRIANDLNVAATRDVPPNGPLQRNISIPVELNQDPKAVRARFVVRVQATGRIGSADVVLGP